MRDLPHAKLTRAVNAQTKVRALVGKVVDLDTAVGRHGVQSPCGRDQVGAQLLHLVTLLEA